MTPESLPIAFDPQWRITERAWLRVHTLARLLKLLQSAERRELGRSAENARRYALAVECLLANVVALRLAAPGNALAVRRWGGRRAVDADVYGFALTRALDAAERAGLFIPGRKGVYSTVEPTPELLAMLPTPLPWSVLYQTREQPALLLRGRKNAAGRAPVIGFTSSAETAAMAGEMAELNAWWHSLRGKMSDPEVRLDVTKDGQLQRIVTKQHTHCVRIFNNGTFAQGGRLFRGWWVDMEKAERFERIEIGGEPVAEVDYSAQYLRLAYRAAGAGWPFADGEDPYLPDGFAAELRDAFKACTLALLNGAKGRQFPDDVAQTFQLAGLEPGRVYAAIRQRHSGLQRARAFGTTLGLELARVDSDLMVRLLMRLKAARIPALPIHDAVVCARSRAEDVAGIMEETALAELGHALPVKIRTA